MRMVILGGAGAMAGNMAVDLREFSSAEEFIVADVRLEAARRRCEELGDPRFRPALADASNKKALVDVLKGAQVCVNCSQYNHNITVMEACLAAGTGYIDLGGLFHVTREQKGLHEAFRQARVPAVIGMGSTPGTMNVLARYGVDLLDRVKRADALCAWIEGDKGDDGPFIPPYALRTIMEEMTEEAWAFEDGELRPYPPGSGEEVVEFPEPIGRTTCHRCLHSEPATWPVTWRDKGIQGCSFKIGMPDRLRERMAFLVRLGFHRKEALSDLSAVSPLEYLERLIAIQARAVPKPPSRGSGYEVLRARVIGTKDGLTVCHNVDLRCREHSRWGISVSTGTPPSIVSGYILEGRIPPGVYAPEEVIDPIPYFEDLGRREMYVHVETVYHPVDYPGRTIAWS